MSWTVRLVFIGALGIFLGLPVNPGAKEQVHQVELKERRILRNHSHD